MPPPPRSEAELLDRARALAGSPLGALALRFDRPAPPDLRRAKGWVGQLLEAALGATASSRPAPDFTTLGVELKTVPVDRLGAPRESTYVSVVELDQIARVRWEDSLVRKKLARVLWVPVEAEPEIPLGERKIGAARLWSPSPDEEAALKEDWEDFATLIAEGWIDALTAERGRHLQVRPKAANARARTWGVDHEGGRVPTLPRGFYLRRSFTAAILRGDR